MNSEDFDRIMRGRETYSTMTIPKGHMILVRCDGRGFTKHTQTAGYTKPFDGLFHSHMVRCAKRLLVELGGIYATTHSDEISVLMHPHTQMFNRRSEKIASVSAGLVSAEFGQAFDGRVSLAVNMREVVDYFSWRQADAKSNFLSSLAYWTLRKKGLSASVATSTLHGAGADERVEILARHGVDPDTSEAWMKRGADLSLRHVERAGFNPKTQTEEVATRTLIDVNGALRSGDEYREWLAAYLAGYVEKEPVNG